MTDSSKPSNRFAKPEATRDFTRSQFDLIQSSHEWEKLRAHAQREREIGDIEPPSAVEMPPDELPSAPVREPSTPMTMPEPKRPNTKGVVNQQPASDTEQSAQPESEAVRAKRVPDRSE